MHTVLRRGNRGDEVRVLQGLLHLYQDGIFGKLTEEAVMEFQKSVGLAADGVVGEKTWKRLEVTKIVRSKRTITEIIVHCTDTPEGRDHTVDDIRIWHKAKGWSDVGYHYIVYRDGTVHLGRDVKIAGAHCSGHNAHSIGICYIGGCEAMKNARGEIVPRLDKTGHTIPKDTRTPEQKLALHQLLIQLRELYPAAMIRGHRDFSSKSCPCFDARKEYKNI